MGKIILLLLTFFILCRSVHASTIAATGFETGAADEITLSGATIENGVVRSGNYALRANAASESAVLSGVNASGVSADFSAATAYYRFYFRYSALPSGTGSSNLFLAQTNVPTPKLFIDIWELGHADARKLAIYSAASGLIGTGTTALQADTWYRIEAKVSTGNPSAWEIKLDGNVEASGSDSLDTANNARVRFGNVSTGCDFWYDDILISDSAYPGAGVGLLATPNGNGNYTAWGSGEYADTDEIPHDSDTTIASTSGASTQAETFAMRNFTASGISSVKPIAIVRNASGATNTGSLRLRSNTTDNDTTAADPGASYVIAAKYLDVDPATSAAWTESGINGAEVGYVKTQSEAREMRMTAAYLYVDAATLTLVSETTARRSQPMFFQ